MQCIWSSASQCLKLFKGIQHTNKMVNLTFDENGLHIMTMDTPKLSLVKLHVEPGDFEEYRCTMSTTLGVYTEGLTNILQKAKKHKLIWSSSNDTELRIAFVQEDQKTEFTMRTIDIEEDLLDVPELQDDVALRVPREVLQQWLDTMLMSKDDVRFMVQNNQITLQSTSTELGTISHSEPIPSDRVQMGAFRNAVDMSLSTYACKSLVMFAAMGGDNCFLGLSNEQPSRIKVGMGDDSYVSLYVAPKISEDD